MEDPEAFARADVVSTDEAFFVSTALGRPTRQVRRAHNDRVSGHDRRGVQTDLAGNEIHCLVHLLLEIDDAVFSKPGYRPADLGVESDHVVARCDVDDPLLTAVGPVRQATARKLSRRCFPALALVVAVLPQ